MRRCRTIQCLHWRSEVFSPFYETLRTAIPCKFGIKTFTFGQYCTVKAALANDLCKSNTTAQCRKQNCHGIGRSGIHRKLPAEVRPWVVLGSRLVGGIRRTSSLPSWCRAEWSLCRRQRDSLFIGTAVVVALPQMIFEITARRRRPTRRASSPWTP